MTLETHNSAEFYEIEARAKREGRRIVGLKRGRTNAAWTLVLSDPPQPELAIDRDTPNNFPAQFRVGATHER